MSIAYQSYRLYHWFWGGLDWLYPPFCGGCGKKGQRWCSDCQQKILLLPDSICNFCGLPLTGMHICENCRRRPPSFRALRSWLIFEGPIRHAIHRLKYRRDIGLGDTLVQPLVKFVQKLNWSIDIVVPVPLGQKRLNERGYNQVGVIAHPLALLMGWGYAPGALIRFRETPSQVGLSAEARRENVRDAFVADARRVRTVNVLVVDDVATTGSTLDACSQALLVAGAREVFALTVARALPRHGLQEV